MKEFLIPKLDNERIKLEVERKLLDYNKTGLYDSFIKMMVKTCLVLETSHPKIKRPAYLLLASDHGFIPSVNTHEEVYRNLDGVSLVAQLCKSAGFHLKNIDIGVNHSFESNLLFWLNHGKRIVNWKINKGNKNFREFPAMTSAECHQAIDIGVKLATKEFKIGANCIAVHSLGEGGDYSAEIICAGLLQKEMQNGTLDIEIQNNLKKELSIHPKTHDPITLICLFGGYELACMLGVILQSASQRQIILIQGLKASLALYIASLWHENIVDFAIVTASPNNHWERLLQSKMGVLNLNQQGIDAKGELTLCSALSLIKSGATILRD